MRWNPFKTQTMTSLALMLARTVTIVLALCIAAAPATAAKPSEAEYGKSEHSKQHNKHGKEKAHKKSKEKSKKSKPGKHFSDKDENVVRHYYRDESRNGQGCPPGLAKKNNGCMPPGQAKKQWTTGERLPHDVKHHDLPHDLLSRLPMPPKGQRYVRILTDILLLDANTDVVIDAIVDILIP